MLALRDLQRSIGRSVLGQSGQCRSSPEDHDAAGTVLAEGMAARLWIYRHHYETSLAEALKAIYPAICRLVDERFFEYAAHEYVKANPPRRPCLHEYGEGFPEFLAAFPPCRKLVYLADVARLEWRINAALHAPAEPPLAPGAFRGVGPEEFPRLVFRLLSSAGYLESAWPVDRIWLANQEGRDGSVDLVQGGCRLEIRQLEEQVVFRRVDQAEFALRHALHGGQTLERAVAAARGCEPDFDLTTALRRLLDEGLVVSFSLAPLDSDF